MDINTQLKKGTYRLYLKCSVLPDIVAQIMEALKGIIGHFLPVMKDDYGNEKNIEIIKVKSYKEDDITKIGIDFILINNPVPVAVIVVAVLAVLGVFGAFLTFDKIEDLSESPVGAGFLIGSIALLGLVAFAFIKK